MQTKIHINLCQGIVDVEGDVALVREVYSDFKERLLSSEPHMQTREQDGYATKEQVKPAAKKKKRAVSKKGTEPDADNGGIDVKNPKLDKNLDLSQLPAFYGQFKPKNNPEKILIFAKFLSDKLGIEKPNTDQFYTCFRELNEKIPTVFYQAFRDTHGRVYGYIDYKSATDISVPIKGTNHFNDGIQRTDVE